jgi:hypothetical protein
MRRPGCALLLTVGSGCVIPISQPGTASDGGAVDGAGTVVGLGPDGATPQGDWTNVTGTLANMPSECGNMTSVFAKPDEDLLIAGIAKKGLWSTNDGGLHWVAMGMGAGSSTITNRPSSLVYDPTNHSQFWESGIYNGAGVYVTTDDGTTFNQLGNSTHDDLVSIDFSDPARMTMLAGGHEQAQLLRRSTNGGATWEDVGAGLPAGTFCTFPLVIDAHTHLVGCTGGSGVGIGVYRTTDSGTTWTRMTASGGASAPLVASDRSIYWASPNHSGMTRSTDQGQHWSDVTGPGQITSASPIELPDGRLAALGTRNIVISADQGVTWKAASSVLPYGDAVGLVYSSQRRAFYIWHFTCGANENPVPADAIQRFNFDYQRN